MSFDLCPTLFWKTTLRVQEVILNGRREAEFQKQNLSYYNAWHSGLFSQNYEKKKFPDYDKGKPKKKEIKKSIKDWRVIKQMFETFNAAMGGFDNRKSK